MVGNQENGVMMFYRIFNSNGDVMAYGARMCEDLGDGYKLFRTGSCSLPAQKWEPLKVGDTFSHWQEGLVTVKKINRKTMKVERYNGSTTTLPVG